MESFSTKLERPGSWLGFEKKHSYESDHFDLLKIQPNPLSVHRITLLQERGSEKAARENATEQQSFSAFLERTFNINFVIVV